MNKYEHLSKEELIRVLVRRDAERPLGLVWEREEIEFENKLNNNFVSLEINKELSVGEEPWDNLIIEGDNFDALRYLKMTHSGKIKVIFIDPPYNTGNKDFIYNDDFVSKDDNYRHSKWLEFMYQRLTIAKELLSQDGVMFINIGEDELANLTLLMEKVMPNRKVTTFVWRKRVGASDEDGYNVSMDHDYILCYANPDFSFAGSEKDLNKYSNPDNDPRGPWMSADLSKGHNRIQRPNTYYPIRNPETDIWYPCSEGNVWRFSTLERIKEGQKTRKPSMEEQIADGKVLFPEPNYVIAENMEDLKNLIISGQAPDTLALQTPDLEFFVNKKLGIGRPRYKRHLAEMKSTNKPLSTFIGNIKDKVPLDHESEYIQSGLNTEGTNLLKQVLGSKIFDYPKPLSLIKNLLAQVTKPDSNDIVLDFFAGSGTTAHAVLSLNEEDEGNRKFILVSSTEATKLNPEVNVCKDVTRERMKNVIKGYSYRSGKKIHQVEGLESNFAYAKTVIMPIEKVNLKIEHNSIWIALQMVNNLALNDYNEDKDYQLNFNEIKTIIYIEEISEKIIKELKTLCGEYRNIVIYSWEPGFIKQALSDKELTVNKIPDYLVEKFGGI